jgi:hypothetical protein
MRPTRSASVSPGCHGSATQAVPSASTPTSASGNTAASSKESRARAPASSSASL